MLKWLQMPNRLKNEMKWNKKPTLMNRDRWIYHLGPKVNEAKYDAT